MDYVYYMTCILKFLFKHTLSRFKFSFGYIYHFPKLFCCFYVYMRVVRHLLTVVLGPVPPGVPEASLGPSALWGISLLNRAWLPGVASLPPVSWWETGVDRMQLPPPCILEEWVQMGGGSPLEGWVISSWEPQMNTAPGCPGSSHRSPCTFSDTSETDPLRRPSQVLTEFLPHALSLPPQYQGSSSIFL